MTTESTVRLLQLGHSSATTCGRPIEISVAVTVFEIVLNCVHNPMNQK